jgi:L-lactate dehydrogenase complex protein LldF
MKIDVGATYDTRVRQALDDERLRLALERATGRLVERRAAAIAAVDNDRFRNEARAVREYTVQHLPTLLEQLEHNLRRNGCHVHWARDAGEATDIVCQIARQHDVRNVVKSKSMVTEEIGLNEALGRAGVKVVETDLGEYIIQLAEEPPSHILAPAIHKRAEDISELFQQKLGMAPSNDPAHMCAVARRELRYQFLGAEMGVSGCNFAVADTGTVCVITNEGNGRMVTSMPPVYVAIAGIERIVPRIEDAVLMWQAASRNATGQDVSVYFSLSSGPRRPGHADGPDEMHVVLVDNGRSRILERGYGDALLCIRCSACINECPVYREIGGHAYGETAYNGPIGAVITPLLAEDPLSACELPFASTLCGACRDVCPVKIDLPGLLLDLRADMTEGGAGGGTERMAARAFAATARRPRRYRWMASVARLVTSVFSRRNSETVDTLPPPLSAWTKTRAFPRMASKSFRKLWSERNG